MPVDRVGRMGTASETVVRRTFVVSDRHPARAGCPVRAREQGLSRVVDAEATEGLADLLQSLQNQYDLWFDKTAFFKMFEDSRGTNWGRQQQTMTFQLPLPMPVPQPPAQP